MITPQMPLYSWWGLNKAIFLFVNGLHAHWWDAVMLAATNAGSPGTFPYWIAVALLFAWLRPAVMPQLNVTVFAAGYVATGFLVPWLKSIIDFPRPFVALGTHVVTVIGHTPNGASFPSGHATFVVLLCAALTPGVPKPIRWVLWVFAAAVMLSRIVVGAHFPADVLGGAILGFAVAVVIRVVLAFARR
jgi:membrane-associated phospholipid phosphatase